MADVDDDGHSDAINTVTDPESQEQIVGHARPEGTPRATDDAPASNTSQKERFGSAAARAAAAAAAVEDAGRAAVAAPGGAGPAPQDSAPPEQSRDGDRPVAPTPATEDTRRRRGTAAGREQPIASAAAPATRARRTETDAPTQVAPEPPGNRPRREAAARTAAPAPASRGGRTPAAQRLAAPDRSWMLPRGSQIHDDSDNESGWVQRPLHQLLSRSAREASVGASGLAPQWDRQEEPGGGQERGCHTPGVGRQSRGSSDFILRGCRPAHLAAGSRPLAQMVALFRPAIEGVGVG